MFNMPFCFCLAGNKQGAGRRVWVVVKTKPQTQMCQGKGRRGGGGPLHRSLKHELLGAISRPWMGAVRSLRHLPTMTGKSVTSPIEGFTPE